MKKAILITAILALLLTACGGSGSGTVEKVDCDNDPPKVYFEEGGSVEVTKSACASAANYIGSYCTFEHKGLETCTATGE